MVAFIFTLAGMVLFLITTMAVIVYQEHKRWKRIAKSRKELTEKVLMF